MRPKLGYSEVVFFQRFCLQVTTMRISTKAGCMNYLLLLSKLTTKDLYKTIWWFWWKTMTASLKFHQSQIFGSGSLNGKQIGQGLAQELEY